MCKIKKPIIIRRIDNVYYIRDEDYLKALQEKEDFEKKAELLRQKDFLRVFYGNAIGIPKII